MNPVSCQGHQINLIAQVDFEGHSSNLEDFLKSARKQKTYNTKFCTYTGIIAKGCGRCYTPNIYLAEDLKPILYKRGNGLSSSGTRLCLEIALCIWICYKTACSLVAERTLFISLI